MRPGDIVVWHNRDIVPHSVTARDGAWDSGTIAAGGRWRTRIAGATGGGYLCRFHPAMTATLAVAPE